MKVRSILSICFKSIVFIAALVGIVSLFYISGFMGGKISLLYFTVQSNMWIALTCLIGIPFIIIRLVKGKDFVKKWMYILKFVFTVSITITGLVFCFVLAPLANITDCWNLSNILTHIVVPVFAIADFFVYDAKSTKYTHFAGLFALIPMLYYVVFAAIGFVCKWDFSGTGINYPYFFLDWGSKAGAFGFSNEVPFMGVVYWIVAFIIFVLFLSVFYIFLGKLIFKKKGKEA